MTLATTGRPAPGDPGDPDDSGDSGGSGRGGMPAGGDGGRGRRRAGRRPWPGMVLMGLVLAVALAVGSGVGSSGRQSDAQRAAALDTQIRCPSCDDLSVAQSSASEAVAVRQQVARLVRQGRTNAQIEQTLVDEWGPTILLRPPVSGLTALVWIVPIVVAAGALGAVGVLFWRRGRDLTRLRRRAQ